MDEEVRFYFFLTFVLSFIRSVFLSERHLWIRVCVVLVHVVVLSSLWQTPPPLANSVLLKPSHHNSSGIQGTLIQCSLQAITPVPSLILRKFVF